MALPFRLYLVTDRFQCGLENLPARVASALRGGVGAVQLREKDLPSRALRELAAALLACCRRHGVPLLVNDRVDVALAVGADGVHLPANSFLPSEARRLLGPGKLIGVSTHHPAEVSAAHRAGADFAVFGPVFSTPSKQAFGPPAGLNGLRDAVKAAPIPVFAIGGIHAARVPEVLAAGAYGVAAISAILGAESPEQAARELCSLLAQSPCPRAGS